MALATVNLVFADDFVKQIDYFANTESLTRADLIYNSLRMYINRKEKLQELFAYGEQVVMESGFTEKDVMEKLAFHSSTSL